jgi:ankyrin repeat protein
MKQIKESYEMIITKKYSFAVFILISFSQLLAMRHDPYKTKKFRRMVARIKKEDATYHLKGLLSLPIWRQPYSQLKAIKLKIKDFILNGADPTSSDEAGDTALSFACQFGMPDLVDLLLKKGASPNQINANKQNALMFAIYVGDGEIEKDVFKLLVKYNIDLNQKDSLGSNALKGAIQFGYPHTADLLINAGADPEIKVNGKNAYEFSAAVTKECREGRIRPDRRQAAFFSGTGSKQKIR